MSAPGETPQSRITETAPPDATASLEPLPPKPQPDSPTLDLQAIRLAGVATTAITERLRRHGVLPRDDEQVLGEVAAYLSALLDEVKRLSQEVTTREAAARHALDAATKARQETDRLRAELEETQDDRAAAYLVEAQAWDLLDRAAEFLPDNVLADPERPILDRDLGQLRHDIARYFEAQPPEDARALWERLRTAETVCDAVENPGCACAPPPQQVRDAMAVWKTARAGGGQ